MPVVTKSIDQAAAHITSEGHSWSNGLGIGAGPITFAFRSTAGTDNATTFSRFSAAQIAAAEEVLDLWSDVANISFNRVGGAGYSNNATMLFANYNNPDDGAAAYAYYPDPDDTGVECAARRCVGRLEFHNATTMSRSAPAASRPCSTRSATPSVSSIRATTMPAPTSRSPMTATPNTSRTPRSTR